MSVTKQARQDAFEMARADMYFGDGAGTRRKLIYAAVDHKYLSVPGYAQAFDQAYARQDWAKHAKDAKKERKHKDAKEKVERNVNAILSGNHRRVTPAIGVVLTVAVVAHQTGYDKVAVDYSKKKYGEAKRWVRRQRVEYRLRKANLHKVDDQ